MDDLGAPIAYLVLKTGVPVYARDGERLGQVTRVLSAPEANMFDGIIIDGGRLDPRARRGADDRRRRGGGAAEAATLNSGVGLGVF
jgi:hypothetical protein